MKPPSEHRRQYDHANPTVEPIGKRTCAAHGCWLPASIDVLPEGGGVCRFHYGEPALAWQAITQVVRKHAWLIRMIQQCLGDPQRPWNHESTVRELERRGYGQLAEAITSGEDKKAGKWAYRANAVVGRMCFEAAAEHRRAARDEALAA